MRKIFGLLLLLSLVTVSNLSTFATADIIKLSDIRILEENFNVDVEFVEINDLNSKIHIQKLYKN